jgi:hypothetical protein
VRTVLVWSEAVVRTYGQQLRVSQLITLTLLGLFVGFDPLEQTDNIQTPNHVIYPFSCGQATLWKAWLWGQAVYLLFVDSSFLY